MDEITALLSELDVARAGPEGDLDDFAPYIADALGVNRGVMDSTVRRTAPYLVPVR